MSQHSTGLGPLEPYFADQWHRQVYRRYRARHTWCVWSLHLKGHHEMQSWTLFGFPLPAIRASRQASVRSALISMFSLAIDSPRDERQDEFCCETYRQRDWPTETKRSTAICTASPTRLIAWSVFSLVLADDRGFSLKLIKVEIWVTNGTRVVSMDLVLISKDFWEEEFLCGEAMTIRFLTSF